MIILGFRGLKMFFCCEVFCLVIKKGEGEIILEEKEKTGEKERIRKRGKEPGNAFLCVLF
jgi:hypothetical protein